MINRKEEFEEDFQEESKYLQEGESFKVEFTSYTHEGLGVAKIECDTLDGRHLENYPLFVENAIVGEQGFVKITKIMDNFSYAKIDIIFKSSLSPERVSIPICPHYPACGGCNLLHMSYKEQLRFKTQMVKDTLEHLGGFTDIEVRDIIGMGNNPYYYRNKVQVPVQNLFNKKTVCGFFENNTHNIIPLDKCYIQPEISTEIVKFTKNIFNEYGIIGFNEKYKSGNLRHILVRTNNDLSEIMIVVVLYDFNVVSDKGLMKQICSKIKGKYPNVTSIIANANNKPGNTILGDKFKILDGDATIKDTLLGKSFNIGPKSFYQVNHNQCEVLYKTALDAANLSKEDIFIDAYCGIGTIGIIASDYVKQVYGVEIVDEAIDCANANAYENNVKNINFVCNKAEVQIANWLEEGIKPTVLLVDPPRKGCDKSLLDSVINADIKKMIYISCDVATLARDLKYMSEAGYTVQFVQPVDMFAQNSHVENVACLIKK